MFEHTIVASSWVTEVWFDGDLVIAFNNGDIARFPGTNIGMYYALILSGSPGHFVNTVLKGWPYMKCGRPVQGVAIGGPLPCDPGLTGISARLKVVLTFGTVQSTKFITYNSGTWTVDYGLTPSIICAAFGVKNIGMQCFTNPGTQLTLGVETSGPGDQFESVIDIPATLHPFFADFGVLGQATACGQTNTDISAIVEEV